MNPNIPHLRTGGSAKKDPKMVVPNSCNSCHKEWAKTLEGYEAGVKAYETKFKK